jgi:regulatory protein YycI of two-component signal transduction system YycFG
MRDIFLFIIVCLISVFLALISIYLEKRSDDKREQKTKEWLEKDLEE